jgi:hypothetical protein
MNTIFSQIDNRNFAPDGQNLITRTGGLPAGRQGATLADSVVAFAQNMIYSFAHKPSNQAQGRRLQLNKILYS